MPTGSLDLCCFQSQLKSYRKTSQVSVIKEERLKQRGKMCVSMKLTYCIAGNFGRNYIWRKGLQAAKNKYWRNLNLAIGNRAYKFSLCHRVSYGTSPHVVQLKCKDQSRSHGRVSTRELCSRSSHIYTKSTWTPLLASRPMLDFSICFLKILLG